jgi:hypothetical protein
MFWSHSVAESKGNWWFRLDGSPWTSVDTNTNASDTAVTRLFLQDELVCFTLCDWDHTLKACHAHQPSFDHELIAWFEPGAAGESAFVDKITYVTHSTRAWRPCHVTCPLEA